MADVSERFRNAALQVKRKPLAVPLKDRWPVMLRSVARTIGTVVAVSCGWFLRGFNEVPPNRLEVADTQLLRELAGIEGSFARLEEALRGGSAAAVSQVTPIREPETVQALPTEQDLSRLSKELSDLTALIRMRPSALLPSTRGPSRNADTIRSLAETARNHLGELCRDHYCWTPATVYAAYGMPDDSKQVGWDLTWDYFPSDSEEGVRFTFQSGYVDRVNRMSHPARR